MNYPLISEYIEAIKAAEDNFEQLKNLRPVLDEDGEPIMTSGNFAVVFKMKDEQTGKLHAVKCFLKEQEGRAEAYRMIADELEYVNSTFLTPIEYLDKELFVDTNASDETEFPVLLMDWIEGETLDKYIQKYVNIYLRAECLDEVSESEEKAMELLVNCYELETIAYQFSRLAIWLLQQPFAHGDLKPDNIIVKEDGKLVLVDYDGMFVPAMKGQKARELGSPDFRHPLRNEDDFDEHIDDFPLSSILLSLLAIANKPSLLEEYGRDGRLLLSERDYRNIAGSEVLDALRPLMADKNLTTYLSLFYLCSAQKSLFKESYHLFTLPEPEKPSFMVEDEDLSTEVTEEDLANSWTDEFGVKYSKDRKRLLKAPKYLKAYVIRSGTKVISDEAFSFCSLTGITVPDSVTSIGHSAFLGCINLSSITIPDSVKDISFCAFRGCISLSNIIIPDSVTSIRDCVFSDCSSLSSITIPNVVASIGDEAFDGCSSLTSITIPASVTNIGEKAFYGCKSLTSIIIPNGVTSIGNWAFSDCSSLASIVVDDNNPTYDSRHRCNAIIETLSNKLIRGCTNTIIPDSVTSIGDGAFDGCSSLTSITIPNGVTSIGNDVFYGCSSLTSITIPKETRKKIEELLPKYKDKLVEEDDDYSYSGYYWNTKVEFFMGEIIHDDVPEWLQDIKETELKNCYEDFEGVKYSKDRTVLLDCDIEANEYHIPEGVKRIRKNAFYTSKINRLYLPSSLESVEYRGLFSYGIQSIICTDNNPNFKSILGVLYSKNEKTLVAYPQGRLDIVYKMPDSVVKVEEGVFSTNKDIEFNFNRHAVISGDPDVYTDYGFCSFRECNFIKNNWEPINYPYVIISKKFRSNNALSTQILTSNDVYLDKGVVYTANKKTLLFYSPFLTMKEYSVIDGCANIREDAFPDFNYFDASSQCGEVISNGLVKIHLPKSIKNIGDGAFSRCYNLIKIYVFSDKLDEMFDLLPEYKDKLIEKSEEENLSTKVTDEDLENAWTDEYGVKYSTDRKRLLEAPKDLRDYSLIIGTNIICDKAFSSCKNLTLIVIPDSLIAIGDEAFSACWDLTSIVIPDSVKRIGESAFFCCDRLNTIDIPESVTSIGGNAFGGCTGLTSIVIQNNVINIGEYVFDSCFNLTSIVIPAGYREKFEKLLPEYKSILIERDDNEENLSTEVTEEDLANAWIDEYGVLYSCDGTRLLSAPQDLTLLYYSIRNGTEIICNNAFSGHTELKVIGIPYGIKTIGDNAFSCCESIVSLNMPNSITQIGKYAFGWCEGLEYIILSESIKEIREGTFYACNSLATINIPLSVCVIESGAFYKCGCLEYITIPSNVTCIGDEAFGNCANLRTVHIENGNIRINNSVFSRCDNLDSIYIPHGMRGRFDIILGDYNNIICEPPF